MTVFKKQITVFSSTDEREFKIILGRIQPPNCWIDKREIFDSFKHTSAGTLFIRKIIDYQHFDNPKPR